MSTLTPQSPGGLPEGTVIKKGAVKATPEGFFWDCPVCDAENPMEITVCKVCGASLSSALRPPDKERPERDPGTAALISLFLPGAGHAYLGLWGDAVARAVTSLWVSAIVAISLVQGPNARFMAIVFGLAATALWFAGAHDAFQEASGRSSQQLLKGRAFMWVTIGLLLLLMAMVIFTALQGRSDLDTVPPVPDIPGAAPPPANS